MEKLSANLQAKIRANPTNTILRNEKVNKDIIDIPRSKIARFLDLPKQFDGRVVWKGLLNKPMNQGQCGSCWAFASTGTLADRFNIMSMGQLHIKLSPTKLILCGWQGVESELLNLESEKSFEANISSFYETACFGNTLFDAWRYLYTIGTPTEQCIPYDTNLGVGEHRFEKLGAFEDVIEMPLCINITGPFGDMCSGFTIDKVTGEEDGVPERFYKCLHYYALKGTPEEGGSEIDIRNNIFEWGPVSSGMQMYPDFYEFDAKNDIYEWNGKGPQVGGHAVEIVGWGEERDKENNRKYWIIKNSWGSEWGDNGYFRIVRGINNCDIEYNCVTGIPDFFYPLKYEFPYANMWGETPEIIQNRKKVNIEIDAVGGGIDPSTGYSRRIMVSRPWLNLKPPVKLEDLPIWKNFIAGEDASVKNRAIYQSTIASRYEDILFGKQELLLTVIVICVIIGLIGFVIVKNRQKIIKNI